MSTEKEVEVGRGITARSIIVGVLVFVFSIFVLALSFHNVPGGNFEWFHWTVYL